MREKYLERILKSLANERRLAMLAHLKRADAATISTVAKRVKLPFKTVARNLKILERAGVIEKTWDSARVIYQLAKVRPKFVEFLFAEL